jgi:hypothetical protein
VRCRLPSLNTCFVALAAVVSGALGAVAGCLLVGAMVLRWQLFRMNHEISAGALVLACAWVGGVLACIEAPPVWHRRAVVGGVLAIAAIVLASWAFAPRIDPWNLFMPGTR